MKTKWNNIKEIILQLQLCLNRVGLIVSDMFISLL